MLHRLLRIPPSARSLVISGPLILAALTGPVTAATAGSPELAHLLTIAGPDHAMVYRPIDLDFGPDGEMLVLNAGDCRVLAFSPDGELIRSFGRQGEGPGEFENPTGLLVRQDEVWVFQMMRVTVFALDGTYLRTLTSRVEMHAPLLTRRGLLVRLGASDRLAALLGDDLALREKLGPECPHDGDFLAEYRACGFVHTLPHPDHLALLINPIDGTLWALAADGSIRREMQLVAATGRSSVSEPDGDGRVMMSFTMVLAAGGVDRHGRLWTAPLDPDAEDTGQPQTLVVRDRDLAPVARFTLPAGVGAFVVRQHPDGRLVLLDTDASLVHVCAYPASLAAVERPAR